MIKQNSCSALGALIPSPLERIKLSHWPSDAPTVLIKRDDLIHPIVSGNKWRKLQYLPLSPTKHAISIGGGHSNHLHALAYLCHESRIKMTALVRGDYSMLPTPMLKDIQQWGCNIQFISKKRYAIRETAEFKAWLNEYFGSNIHFIPEGGSTQYALKGMNNVCLEVAQQTTRKITHFVSPVASGATLAGLISGKSDEQSVIGVAVLKGQHYLEQQVQRFIHENTSNWFIDHTFHHGGYAKTSEKLRQFIDFFQDETHVPIEPVYSAKLFYALDQMIVNKKFGLQDTVVALHTGGLQGARHVKMN